MIQGMFIHSYITQIKFRGVSFYLRIYEFKKILKSIYLICGVNYFCVVIYWRNNYNNSLNVTYRFNESEKTSIINAFKSSALSWLNHDDNVYRCYVP